ncbi:MAG TPA: hypothetical protein VH815_16610, partial [Acidobacteriota bacterium]
SLLLCRFDEKILHFKEKTRRLMKLSWNYHISKTRKGLLLWNAPFVIRAIMLLLKSNVYRKAWKKDFRHSK